MNSFGIGLLILGFISAFSYTTTIRSPLLGQGINPMQIAAIANTCSLLLFSAIYYQLRLFLNNHQQTQEQLLKQIANFHEAEVKTSEFIHSLQESIQCFQIALKNSLIILSNQDSQLRYTWVYNPASGVDSLTLIGKLDSELFNADNAEQLIPIKQRVLRTGRGERQEVLITVDGEIRYYDLTVEPLRNETGVIVGITCAAANITEIRVREQKLRAIFEESLDAILITDDQGYFTEVNQAAAKLFKLPASQLIGRQIADFMEPGFDFAAAWQQFIRLGELTGEIRICCLDGTIKQVEYAAKADFIPGHHFSVLRDITIRQTIEKELRYRESLLSNILNSLPVGVWITNPQGLIIQRNPAGEQIWAGSRYVGINQYNEYKGWWADTGKPIESHEWALARAITQGETSINEMINIECFDGTHKTILNSAIPLWNEHQEIIGAIVVNQDITELKQVEAALRSSNHFIQQITNTTPNLLYIYDLVRHCNVYANRSCEEFFGLTQTQIQAQGQSFIQAVLHPDDRFYFNQIQEQYITAQEGEVIENEIRLRNAHGEWRWLHLWEVVFSRTQEGFPAQILGTAIDITEHRKLQAQLSASEERFRTSIENLLDCFCIYSTVRDSSGKIVNFVFEYVNSAACKNNNLSKEEQLEKGLCELLPAHRELGLFDEYCQVVETGKPLIKEAFLYQEHFQGRKRDRAFDIRAVKLGDGLAIAWRDVTERQQAEEIRRQLEREQELSQLRLRFFSLASHEFRTPLSTILASAQLLQLMPWDWSEEKRLRNVRRIESSAKRIRQILDDILTINRAETGKLDVHRTWIDIEEFCQQLVTELMDTTDPQPHLVLVSQSSQSFIYVDTMLLRYILINILSNAIKYAPPDSEVELKLTVTKAETIFQIQDSGWGIPTADLPYVFEAFYRGSNMGTNSGSGLGLTVAKNCADVQGGTITITSDLGVGTTVMVTLPHHLTVELENADE